MNKNTQEWFKRYVLDQNGECRVDYVRFNEGDEE